MTKQEYAAVSPGDIVSWTYLSRVTCQAVVIARTDRDTLRLVWVNPPGPVSVFAEVGVFEYGLWMFAAQSYGGVNIEVRDAGVL